MAKTQDDYKQEFLDEAEKLFPNITWFQRKELMRKNKKEIELEDEILENFKNEFYAEVANLEDEITQVFAPMMTKIREFVNKYDLNITNENYKVLTDGISININIPIDMNDIILKKKNDKLKEFLKDK